MGFSRNQILSSFVWKLLEKFSVQIVTFIVTILLARLLTPNEYGIVAIITIFINLANVIVDGGLNTALIQKKNADNIDFSTILYASIALSVVVYVVLYVCAPYIAAFYENDALILVLRVLSIIVIPCAINAVQKAYVSKHLLFRTMCYCSLLSVIVSGVIGIAMAKSGFGVWSLVAQNILNQVLITVVMAFAVKWKPILTFSFVRFKSLFNYGWKIFLSNFIIAIYEDIRGLLIGKLYQPEILAFFDRGKQFPSLIMGNVNTSIQTVLLPAFAEDQDDRLKVKGMMRRATQVSCFFIFPLMIGLVVTAEPLVLFLLKEPWLPAVPFVRIFSIALLFMPIQSSNMIAIKSLGYSGITLKIEIVKKILEAIILVISFQINVYAVAMGMLIYNFFCIFINLAPNKKLLDYSIIEQIKDIFPSLICAVIMGAVVYPFNFLPFGSFLKLVLSFLAGAAIYLLLCVIFRVESVKYIVNVFRNIKGKI